MAKWRVRTSQITSSKLPKAFESIFDRLRKILGASLEKLNDGEMDDSPRVNVPATVEDEVSITPPRQGEAPAEMQSYSRYNLSVKRWMEETGPIRFGVGSSYDQVMRKWLSIRTQVSAPTRLSSPKSSRPEAHLVPNECPECEEKLRCCVCDSCDDCGELTSACTCKKCGTCEELVGHCKCKKCQECQKKANLDKRIFCACVCPKCEKAFSFADDGFGSSDGCACKRSTGNKRQIMRDLSRRKSSRSADERRKRERDHVLNAMHAWISTHQPGYFAASHRSSDARVELGCVSGTYALLSGDTIETERQEIVITRDDQNIIGRFRYADSRHGLFQGGAIPEHATTSGTPCNIVAENADRTGSWRSIWPSAAHPNGDDARSRHIAPTITFLGEGLIKVSPSFFESVNDHVQDDVFGVRLSEYHEDCEALKESWDAIQRTLPPGPTETCQLYSTPTALKWDEELVDDWVQRLYIS